MPPKIPKKAAETSEGVTVSGRDQELLAGALRSAKNAITIDYQKFADTCGFGTAASAKTAWYNLKKKVGLPNDPDAAKAGAQDGTKAGCKGRRKRKVDAEAAEDDEEPETSPVKKAKGGKKDMEDETSEAAVMKKGNGVKKPAKKAKVAEAESEGEGETGAEAEVAVSKKQKGAKEGPKRDEAIESLEEVEGEGDGEGMTVESE